MKTSIISLLFAAAFLAIIPISPQITSRGVVLKVDTKLIMGMPGA